MDFLVPLDLASLGILLGSLLPSLSVDSPWFPYITQSLEKTSLKSKVTSQDRRNQAVGGLKVLAGLNWKLTTRNAGQTRQTRLGRNASKSLQAFYSLPRSPFIGNILAILAIYVILRQAYRVYATRAASSVTALASTVLGALIHQFRTSADRLAVSAATRRLGVDDEAAALRRIANWNVFAAACGLIALTVLVGEAIDAVEAYKGKPSSVSSKAKSKKDKSGKAAAEEGSGSKDV